MLKFCLFVCLVYFFTWQVLAGQVDFYEKCVNKFSFGFQGVLNFLTEGSHPLKSRSSKKKKKAETLVLLKTILAFQKLHQHLSSRKWMSH